MPRFTPSLRPSQRTTSSNASADSLSKAFDIFADEVQTVKKYCPRIRVLVIGARNAGKTTLLQKMTRSSDGKFVLRNKNGLKVHPEKILEPSRERGRSQIEYEITYPSDKDYVFHDSKGMEAGSIEEVRLLNDFIKLKREKKHLGERLHVIWLCLPVDTDRPLSAQEMAFFDHGTEGVPVIAIFTKFEWRITKAYDELRDNKKSIDQAKTEAFTKALYEFEEIRRRRFANVSHRPAACVYLQEMNRPSGNCDSLTHSTRQLVAKEIHQQLFAEIKRNNVEIKMAIALVYAIVLSSKADLASGAHSQVEEWTIFLLSLFPFWDNYLKVTHAWNWNFAEKQFKLAVKVNNPSTPSVIKIMEGCLSWVDTNITNNLQLLTYFIDVLMISEHTYWVEDQKPWDHVDTILAQYRNSPERNSLCGIISKLYLEMHDSEYQHTAMAWKGPLQSPSLRVLALKYTPLLMEHRL